MSRRRRTFPLLEHRKSLRSAWDKKTECEFLPEASQPSGLIADIAPAGRYAAWCFDPLTEIDPGAGAMYGGYLHSSCDTNLNHSLPNHPGVAVSPLVLNRLNNLINHRRLACNGVVPTMWQVQTAVFTIMRQPLYPSPPYPTNRAEVVQCLVNDANNNAAGWIPQCGDKIAAIYNTDINWDNISPEVQFIFLEVPCPYTSLGDFVWVDDNADGIQNEPTSHGVNAGLVELAELGDYVWEDIDFDGQQDGTEPGIENVLVTLNGVDIHGNAVRTTGLLTPAASSPGRMCSLDLRG